MRRAGRPAWLDPGSTTFGASLISRPLRWAAQGAAVAVVAVGALSMAQYDKAVSLSLDGQTSSVHVFGSTVGDLLAKQDLTV
ncbi:MAG TPA: ubiquitin-like domain-containing protein, partial [Lapillicoccus sp.]|nr:ubiquitin-like domain-containing protein [Lapillicoccus sp.]